MRKRSRTGSCRPCGVAEPALGRFRRYRPCLALAHAAACLQQERGPVSVAEGWPDGGLVLQKGEFKTYGECHAARQDEISKFRKRLETEPPPAGGEDKTRRGGV